MRKIKYVRNSFINQGSVLLTEKPFVYVLKSKLKGEICDNCFQRRQLLRCAACAYVQYCNRECQKQSWEDHKVECGNLRRVAPRIVPDAARLLARIIFKLKRGGGLERRYYTETKSRTFKDLMSHYSNVKQDKLRVEHLSALSVVLTEFIGESNMPNSAELMAMYGRMSVNSFNILDPEMLSVGTGIYLGASIIDHSCDPNAVAVFQGTTILIRTLRDIPALDWDKIFISYIDLLNFPQERRKELQQTYYFLCECRRCNDVEELAGMSSVVCPNQGCREPVPVPTHPLEDRPFCLTCGAIISDEMHQEYLEVAEFTQDQLNVMNNIAYLDVCKVCLKKQSGIFHKQDMLRARVVDLAFESSIEMGQFPLAREYGEELVSSYRKYYGPTHPLLGLLHLKLAKLLLYLEESQEAVTHAWLAQKVLKVTHGEDHSLYQGELAAVIQQCHSHKLFQPNP